MAKARKTVELEKLRNWANSYILHSADRDEDARRGVASLIETALMDREAYKGFRYLTPQDMTNSLSGAKCGIDYTADGEIVRVDDSRRHYY